ncbi:MAG: hypothetical protein QXO70_03165 [Candidatus Pacearchaeota archaeon]
MCEKCAKSEGLPIVKMPTESDAVDFVLSREPKPPKLQTLQNDLIENYRWHIQMERRRAKLTTKQLAQKLGEPEEAIIKLEMGHLLPKLECNRLINKMEQFFRIKLKKESGLLGSDIELVEDVFNERLTNNNNKI